MKRFKPGVSFGDFVVTDIKESKSRRAGEQEREVDYRRGWVIWLLVLAVMVGLAVRLGALQIFEGENTEFWRMKIGLKKFVCRLRGG